MTPPSDPPEESNDAAMEAMENQVEVAWNMMLSQATAAGFTREQIITLTLSTAAAILDASTKALWPDVDTPEGERYARYAYAAHRGDLRNDAENWGHRTEPTYQDPRPDSHIP